jgi:hypothetical protein
MDRREARTQQPPLPQPSLSPLALAPQPHQEAAGGKYLLGRLSIHKHLRNVFPSVEVHACIEVRERVGVIDRKREKVGVREREREGERKKERKKERAEETKERNEKHRERSKEKE